MIIPASDPFVTERHVRTTVTFDGTAGGGEAGTAVPVFTTTGRVVITRLTKFCTTSLTESGATATISLGVASEIDLLSAVTNAVDLDEDEWWGSGGAAGAGAQREAVTSFNDGEGAQISESININPLVTNVTAGVIVVDAWYIPVTDGGSLVAA